MLLEVSASRRTWTEALEFLEGLGPEGRHSLYQMLELEARLDTGGGLTVGGIPCESPFMPAGWNPRPGAPG